MSDIVTFSKKILDNIKINKKFLKFIITNNKSTLTEIILCELLKGQINEKPINAAQDKILELLKNNNENIICLNFNKRKSNDQFLFYDICINTNYNSDNLYEFKNISENIVESLATKKVNDLIYLQIDKESKNKILEEFQFIKVPNTNLTEKLIKKFGFDWFFKDNFFKKINLYGNSNNFYNSTQYLKNLDRSFKLLFSNYFINFSTSRSDFLFDNSNHYLNFYGTSESFINFFDENLDTAHVVKLNIGETKFQEALHKLDSLCLEKHLVNDNDNKSYNFTIQSGTILL